MHGDWGRGGWRLAVEGIGCLIAGGRGRCIDGVMGFGCGGSAGWNVELLAERPEVVSLLLEFRTWKLPSTTRVRLYSSLGVSTRRDRFSMCLRPNTHLHAVAPTTTSSRTTYQSSLRSTPWSNDDLQFAATSMSSVRPQRHHLVVIRSLDRSASQDTYVIHIERRNAGNTYRLSLTTILPLKPERFRDAHFTYSQTGSERDEKDSRRINEWPRYKLHPTLIRRHVRHI